jgi:periplasmic protein TonB
MFENYVGAKTRKRRTWVTVLITVSVVMHAAGVSAMIIKGFWTIDKLSPPKRELALAVAPPPPPPPPPPPSSQRKEIPKDKVVKVRPQDTTQPVDKPDDRDVDVVVVDADDGVEGGVEGGVAGGVVGGVVGGIQGLPGGVINKPPPPPPPPEKPQVVPQVAIEAKRVAGEKNIIPDESTKLQIKRDGQTQVVATVKMCLTTGGAVSSLNMLKESGYPAYDRKIESTMREWRYQPFVVNGKAVPVCTSVTFIYRQLG